MHGAPRCGASARIVLKRNKGSCKLVHHQMNYPHELSNPPTDFLSSRLLGLTRRIDSVDPQLSRVLVPRVVQHPRYLPGFLRLARTIGQSRGVRGTLAGCRRTQRSWRAWPKVWGHTAPAHLNLRHGTRDGQSQSFDRNQARYPVLGIL